MREGEKGRKGKEGEEQEREKRRPVGIDGAPRFSSLAEICLLGRSYS